MTPTLLGGDVDTSSGTLGEWGAGFTLFWGIGDDTTNLSDGAAVKILSNGEVAHSLRNADT